MNTSTLEPSFLIATMHMTAHKGGAMRRVQGALLTLGLRGRPFTAAALPGELLNGSKHISGAATGALIAQNLLECVGRVKSPHVSAKGRKLDLLSIPNDRVGTARAWLRVNGLPVEEAQQQLALA